jgi:hypothetical protein
MIDMIHVYLYITCIRTRTRPKMKKRTRRDVNKLRLKSDHPRKCIFTTYMPPVTVTVTCHASTYAPFAYSFTCKCHHLPQQERAFVACMRTPPRGTLRIYLFACAHTDPRFEFEHKRKHGHSAQKNASPSTEEEFSSRARVRYSKHPRVAEKHTHML